MECFDTRETTGLESHTSTYLFTQQIQTIRVTEVFFGVKHLQEADSDNSGVTDVYRCCRNSFPERSKFISKDRQGRDAECEQKGQEWRTSNKVVKPLDVPWSVQFTLQYLILNPFVLF